MKYFYNNGQIQYEGGHLNEEKNGKGKEYYETGELRFEGEYLNDKKWNGKEYDKNGNIIYELIKGNGKVKECKIIGPTKKIFEGEYLNGKRSGKGKETFNGKLVYEGEMTKEAEKEKNIVIMVI